MKSLAARLDERREMLPGENAALLLPAMFEIPQSLVGESVGDPFNTPWVSAWRATSWYLTSIPKDVRGSLVVEALRSTRALSVGAILINLNDPTSQEDNKRETFKPALELVTVEAMKTEWLRLIRERSVAISEMINAPDLMSQLYIWRAYASEDEPRKWVEKATLTDEGFATFSSRMMNRGTRTSAGDHVSTLYNSFQRETVESFIGIDEAKVKCDAIDPTVFPEHEDALRTLLRYLEMWLGLRDHDQFDF